MKKKFSLKDQWKKVTFGFILIASLFGNVVTFTASKESGETKVKTDIQVTPDTTSNDTVKK